jgi:hypothetical protein
MTDEQLLAACEDVSLRLRREGDYVDGVVNDLGEDHPLVIEAMARYVAAKAEMATLQPELQARTAAYFELRRLDHEIGDD